MKLLASSTQGAQVFVFISILASLAGLYYYDLSWSTLALVLIGYFVYGCLGIVVTFHRLHTHGSYTARPWLAKLFAVFGCLAGTGSPLAWVAIHINHHLKSDKPGDPHSPLHKGLKIFTLAYEGEIDDTTKWRMRKLVTDRFQQFLHRYYFAIMIGWDILLYAIGGFYLVVFLHLLLP
jgi:stearoyl-CoA desaturase (delta-9 desaturase)